MHSETDFESVENGMRHSRSILLLHFNRAKLSRAEPIELSRTE